MNLEQMVLDMEVVELYDDGRALVSYTLTGQTQIWNPIHFQLRGVKRQVGTIQTNIAISSETDRYGGYRLEWLDGIMKQWVELVDDVIIVNERDKPGKFPRIF